MIDFKRLADDLLCRASALVPSWLPDGRKSGAEWVAKNPRRSDDNLGSFKINMRTGIWKEFSTGEGGGDLISLYAYTHDLSQKEAYDELSSDQDIRQIKPSKIVSKSPWVATGRPGATDATAKDMKWPDRGTVTAWWAVRDADNRPLYYDVRFEREKKDGNVVKDVLPLSWCRNEKNGREKWGYKSFPSPRPLYGHVAATLSPGKIIIIVEGMKCAEKLSDMVGDKYTIITWQGGSNAISKSDWSPVAGARVLIWPDNDDPGFKAATKIVSILADSKCKIGFIRPHEDAPDSWDCADLIDSGADRDFVLNYIHQNRKKKLVDPEVQHESAPAELTSMPPAWVYEQDPDASEFPTQDRPFRVLGHFRDLYFYFPHAKGQIVALRTSAHTKTNLISLAPIEWWEDCYPSKRGVSWTAAQDQLMREADSVGPFSMSKIRGRGAWRDGKDLIVHIGDKIIVNGKPADPVTYKGRYIYERGIRLRGTGGDSASCELGKQVVSLCKLFPWRSDVQGILAAGWAFLAPVCGALGWRPHVWITGEPGSGKTWFVSNVVVPFIRDFGIIVQGSTSAAGVRQTLGNEALPILFDEAEPNDKKSAERMAEIIELARQSSMSGDAMIIKGSATGESVNYTPTSMWCLASIVTAIKLQADQGRISILELCRYNEQMSQHKQRSLREQHRITSDMVGRLFTKGNCSALRSRAFSRLPIILGNIEVFRDQAAEHFRDQRSGDQIGTLLAGAYSLASDGHVTAANAADYIQSQRWDEVLKEEEQEQDHEQLIRHILQYIVRVTTPTDGVIERTIGQLIKVGFSQYSLTSMNRKLARESLSVYGIYLSDELMRTIVFFSPKHRSLERILYGTPWQSNYSRVLMRFPGAEQTQPRKISNGDTRTTQRFIAIDSSLLDFGEFNQPKPQQELNGFEEDILF